MKLPEDQSWAVVSQVPILGTQERYMPPNFNDSSIWAYNKQAHF